jgi:uncharacterized protein
MFINVAQLLKENIGSSRIVQINEPVVDKDIRDVEGELSLLRTKYGILVEGKLTANISSTCSRCLSPVNHRVNFALAEEYFQTVNIINGSFLRNNPENFTIDRNHNLDLIDAVIQYSSLALPMKLLCRPDCAGICSCCGDNLNEGSCTCKIKSSG